MTMRASLAFGTNSETRILNFESMLEILISKFIIQVPSTSEARLGGMSATETILATTSRRSER